MIWWCSYIGNRKISSPQCTKILYIILFARTTVYTIWYYIKAWWIYCTIYFVYLCRYNRCVEVYLFEFFSKTLQYKSSIILCICIRSTRIVYFYNMYIHYTRGVQQCSVTFSIKRFLFGSDDANHPADCPGAVIGFNAVVRCVFAVRAAYDTHTHLCKCVFFPVVADIRKEVKTMCTPHNMPRPGDPPPFLV